jgi:hypothetical protein
MKLSVIAATAALLVTTVTPALAARKGKARKPAPAAPAPAPAPVRPAPVDTTADAAPAEPPARAEPRPAGKPVKSKVYNFTGLDVEGKLKTPQLLYFFDRVKLELDTTAQPKRSFMKELEATSADGKL